MTHILNQYLTNKSKREIEKGSGSGIQKDDLSVMQMSDAYFTFKKCFSKPEMVREHQELIHVQYKFVCDDANCLHIFKTKCGQKRHWENKHNCENNKNGNIVVKQEDQTKVEEQLNVSNKSNASNTRLICTCVCTGRDDTYVRRVNSIWFQKVIHVNIMTLIVCIVFCIKSKKTLCVCLCAKKSDL